ncbi:hypothetical protein T07_385 [Trichinella nelsoni]|uniref:Uncharacterized protein n=1 Tax=Trichinella nelsoni TaxID=6336 RepID=A0A0V0SCH3_9BILA|nr:hypothetical protein T07_385 [Trichinella nelsoni]
MLFDKRWRCVTKGNKRKKFFPKLQNFMGYRLGYFCENRQKICFQNLDKEFSRVSTQPKQ